MADPISGAAQGAMAGSMFGPIGMGVGAAAGLAGGMLQGGRTDRRGYDRALKQQPYANAMMGIGDMWEVKRALEDARKKGTPVDWDALRQSAEGRGLSTGFLDLAQAGGIAGQRKQYQQDFIENIQKGYQGAEDAVRGGFAQAKEGVYGQTQRAQADTSQSMQQSGLMSSNIAQQARANVSYQASRALSEIDTQLSQALADLNLSQSQSMDAALARNLNLDEATTRDFMSMIVGNAGYGPNASNTYFNSSGDGFQSPGIDMKAVGSGVSDIANMFFGEGGFFAKKA